MAKLGYCTVGSNKLEEAKGFYDTLLGSIGMKPMFEHPSGGRIYRGDAGAFGVLGPFDGNPACIGNGSMTGFAFDTREEIDAFTPRLWSSAAAAPVRPASAAQVPTSPISAIWTATSCADSSSAEARQMSWHAIIDT